MKDAVKEDIEAALLSLVDTEDPEMRDTVHDLVHHHSEKAAYLSDAVVPLATIATSTSALTITSVLLLLNGVNMAVKYLAALNILILVLTLTMALVIQIMVFRAKFRISRVQYHFSRNHYLKKVISELDPTEKGDIRMLLGLVRNAHRSMRKIEWSYHHVMWRFFYVAIFMACIITFLMIFIEIQGVLLA